jgi:hypothetical protein
MGGTVGNFSPLFGVYLSWTTTEGEILLLLLLGIDIQYHKRKNESRGSPRRYAGTYITDGSRDVRQLYLNCRRAYLVAD